ncbi:kinase-like protein [Thelephora ganbajun]|uniref:Kinase-like protein n=1 Tax=Thelephora ganbajun TaxID=370292 RepID=A0ACB6Z0S6_THEGA|nr:kinase-like protein [Thelephora ganbajun]
MLGWRLYKLDRSSTRFPQELNELLHDEKWVEQVLDLPGGELVVLVDYLDSTLDGLDRTGTSFRECLHALQKVCSSRMILPSVYEVLTTLSSNAGRTLAYGRLSNIYGGSLDGTDVAVKRLRIPTTGDRATVKQALCREAVVWKHVDHPNIVPFKGVTLESLQLVSEWMPGGELGEYIRNNQGVDLVNLLLGIAKGLDYLHSCDVIYGDLRGANILVDATGNARIVDFGHATIARDTIPPVSNTNGQVSTPRYPAPEILGDGGRCSKESDVFSFGMVMVEVFTGKIPFSNLSTAAAITSITTGDRPKRPTHPSLTDHLWALTQHCWREKPQDRPHMNELIKRLSSNDHYTISRHGP